MTVSNGDVLRAVVEFVLSDGTIAQNVFHFLAEFDTDETNSAVNQAVRTYVQDIYTAISTYLSDDFTINPGYLYRVAWSPTYNKWIIEQFLANFTPSFTHTNTDDPFPNQIAPVMVANTLVPKVRGRKFLMGCVETMADASELVTAALTALGNAVNHYIADETVSGSNQLSPGVIRTASDAFVPFTNGTADSIVGTMRRRKPGVGT